ncbi:MAG: AI-2E family transporter [Piscirickettsiaceae bacterium]|nr:MAG: AI-2E family transporter [Piscirickettsiaceae bacterium]PCH85605.1 MAG: AI-2E family transporter [Piscirickettsiaceae bacterium]
MNSKVMIGFVVFLGLVYLLTPILTPFLSAGLLAYLGTGLVDRLQQFKWSRTLAVSFVFSIILLVLALALLILLPLIEQQISALLAKLPSLFAWFKGTVLPWLQSRLGGMVTIEVDKIQQGLQDNMGTASGLVINLLGSLGSSGMAFFGALANVVLIPVLTFYFLRDWNAMVKRLHEMVPLKLKQQTSKFATDIDLVLGAFFKGQIMVMMALVVVYSLGLKIVGLEFALIIGLIAGLVSFVPYLGLIVGLVLACVAALFQFHNLTLLLPVLIVFVVAQVLESVVLTPMLVGDKIGLHAVTVIFAVMAGGQLFGFTGVLLALPVAAVLMVFLRHASKRYKESDLYSDR